MTERIKFTEVSMPKLDDRMEKGTLVKWLKSEGDEVVEGDSIADISVDLGDIGAIVGEMKAEHTGALTRVIAEEGLDVPVGEAIAVIEEQARDDDRTEGSKLTKPKRTKGNKGAKFKGTMLNSLTTGSRPKRAQSARGESTEDIEGKSPGSKSASDLYRDDVPAAREQALKEDLEKASEKTREILAEKYPDMSEEARKTVVGNFMETLTAPFQQADVQDTATATRRLNVVFSEAAYDDLKELADQSGKTISDVVRDAIALQKWFNGVRQEGGRILVEQRGRVREIMNIR